MQEYRQKEMMMFIAREYKERLFTFIFGREENREWTLSLYNAVNGSNYKDPDQIEFTTIRAVLYMGMHNDVSFIISNQLNLYEQQSSYNPNMPLRMLSYVERLFSQYLNKGRNCIFSDRLVSLPAPKLVVFYNGAKNVPDENWLKLSDSFPTGCNSDIEVRVRMLNIHYEPNKKLLEMCRPLLDYSWFVDTIQVSRTVMGSLEDAVDTALRRMHNDSVIKPFLLAHRAEVIGMLQTEFDEVSTWNQIREQARDEGHEEGLKEGELKGKILATLEFLREGVISLQSAATRLGMSRCQIEELLENPERLKQLDISN